MTLQTVRRNAEVVMTQEVIMAILALMFIIISAVLATFLIALQQRTDSAMHPWQRAQKNGARIAYFAARSKLWLSLRRGRWKALPVDALEAWGRRRDYTSFMPYSRLAFWLLHTAAAVAVAMVRWDWIKLIIKLLEIWWGK